MPIIRGKKLSEETKLRRSLSLKKAHQKKQWGFKKGFTPWNKGKKGLQVAWNKGKKGFTPWNKGKKGLQVAWNKGKPFSEETRKKMSEARKKFFKNGGKAVMPDNRGRHPSRKTIEKIRQAQIGKLIPLEQRGKMSLGRKRFFAQGGKHPMQGKHLSKEKRRKMSKITKLLWKDFVYRSIMSEAHKEQVKNKGKLHYNWQGGKSLDIYTADWTKDLRNYIRERDLYTCQMCGKKQKKKAFDVHHIDYDKDNCDPNNLVTLCHTCHMKTNLNREKWKKYFKNSKLP